MMATQKVAIAIDSSEHSERAMNYYVTYLHRPGNEIVLVQCLDQPLIPHSVHGSYVDDLLAEAKEEAKSVQQKFIAMLKDEKVTGHVVVVADFHKNAGQFICEVAQSKKIQMICMGTRGLGAIKRTLMGSVSDYVVHHAHCPVVVCRQ